MSNITLTADVHAALFFTLGRGTRWILLNKPLMKGEVVRIDKQLPVRSMFNVYTLRHGDASVGFLLTSTFEVTNKGGYLITFFKGKPPADEYDTLIKDDLLVLYDFPNRGSLAISPAVSDDVKVIFEEQ